MGDSQEINQDEIEALLAQVRGASSPTPSPAESSPSAPRSKSGTAAKAPQELGMEVSQNEIEALLQSGTPRKASAKPKGAESRRAGDDLDLLLRQTEQALSSIESPIDPAIPGLGPFSFEDFTGTPPSTDFATLDLLRDVELDLKIELGRTRMFLEDVLRMKRGSVVPLDKLAGDPVDVYVNGRLVARGEVLVLNDNFCVRVAELVAGNDLD